MNRIIEAVLRLSARTGSLAAFDRVSSKFDQVERKAAAYNRAQGAVGRGAAAMGAAMVRYAAPAVLAYGAARAVGDYAKLERSLTRTGLKIGASREEMSALNDDMRRLGQQYGVANAAVIETLDAYAETGAGIREIKSDLAGLVKVQQAMGADGRDVVGTWDAAQKSFGLMTKDAERFFDMIATGGATGKFEGSDLARYLPSLMPLAAANGYGGLEGTATLVGVLETMRDYVGTSQEAATATADFLDKINSPDVQKNFAKFNIDLPNALKDAKKNGEDLFVVMERLIREATGGDEAKLSHLFGEKDSRRVALLLLQNLDKVLGKVRQIRDESGGMIDRNVNEVIADTQTKIDRLWNTLDRVQSGSGKIIADITAPGVDSFNQYLDKDDAWVREMERRGFSSVEKRRRASRSQSDEDYNQIAFDGGYWPDRDKALPELAYPATAPVFRSPDLETVPTPRPARDPFPALARQGELTGVPSDLRAPVKLLGPGDRGIRDFMMSDGYGSVAEFENAIASGGEQAGRSISDAAQEINSAGQEAGSSFRSMLEGVGRQIGTEAAAAFRTNVGTLSVKANVVGSPVRADTGVSRAGRPTE
ncbi:phage tail tape measure protein [Aminobacter niigataensis]|uniref:phage tail tape measure protein n=1 Tax=Aminobacter niigataensis TaxID=83265 RepID=UPI0024C8BA6A|nr:phage tail tape measure protein [Aminobacter niigataensis]CAI2936158.1 protein of unknown function [Aminobacter niigataensis]